MFDGNFRSNRREVNLSGSNRRGGSNKRDLLRNAEAQRKQRQEKQRRLKASKVLQRVTRGHLSRLRTLQICVDHVVWETEPENDSSQKKMAALSVCLSYHPLLTKFDTTRRDLLLEFYHSSQQQQNSNVGMGTHNSDPQPMDTDASDEDSSWFSRKRMIENVLKEFSPLCDDPNDSNGILYKLLDAYRESIPVDDQLFLDLASCLQKWCVSIDEKNGVAALVDRSMNLLKQWAIETSAKLTNPHSKALLATILLSNSNKGQTATFGAEFEEWYTPLLRLLLEDGIASASMTNTNNDVLLEAAMQNLQSHQVKRLLSNLLDLTKSSQLVLLINHVLRQPQNAGLKLAVSLLARGDSIAGKQQKHESPKNDHDKKNDWDDDDDSDDEDEAMDQKPSSHKKARGSTQYKRQEILTMVKLDRHYNARIQQALDHHRHEFDDFTVEVATKIVKAPWKDWGLYLLRDQKREGAKIQIEPNCYVETIGYLLQASSNMRSISKFTPMSPLAFNQTILCELWNLIHKEGERGFTLSIFSDLFSHYLLALTDVDFVKYHCNTDSGITFENRINAKDLVALYGEELYGVYWSKPVVCDEIQMDSARGRLLLSGTKLWNALYERWNRLVNVNFCNENTWWFPYIGSREGDRAVIPGRELDDAESDDDDDSDSMDVDDDRNQLSQAEEASDALADSFRDPKMARVLTCIPQALPFDRRVKLFHSLVKADKLKISQAFASRRAMMAMRGQRDEENDLMMWLDGSIREQVQIKRASLYKDSMETLNKLGPRLKHKIQVTFINKHGAEEAGIDGGGVFKEFLDDLIKDGFASTNNDETENGAPPLFSITPKQQQMTMNLDLSDDANMLVHYEFLGRVLGKAVYESILVEPQFCLPFLNQLLGKVNALEDLKNYDEEYYNNLNQIRHYSEEEIDSLGLTFELTVGGTSPNSKPRTVNLDRAGRSIAVTKKNVFQYTTAVANELLNVLGARQTRAFLTGFRDLIKVAWVRLFSAKELQKMISGDDSVRGIDVSSLRKSVQYLGGYHESQPYVQAFWDILENDFSPEQQRKFLRFMTSCSRQPLLGFSSLEPFPAIQQIRLKDDELSKNSRLPTSSTCMNLLKLPNYKDRELLKEKLLAAVESGAGFELT